MRIDCCPAGPTRSSSTSSRYSELTPVNDTFTSLIGGSPVTATVLGYGLASRSNWSSQPVIVPWSAPASSLTYRLQTPAAAVPSKAAREVLSVDAGAGAGQLSPPLPLV